MSCKTKELQNNNRMQKILFCADEKNYGMWKWKISVRKPFNYLTLRFVTVEEIGPRSVIYYQIFEMSSGFFIALNL